MKALWIGNFSSCHFSLYLSMEVDLKTICDLLDLTNDECCEIYLCSNVNSKQGIAQLTDVKDLFEAIVMSYRRVRCLPEPKEDRN